MGSQETGSASVLSPTAIRSRELIAVASVLAFGGLAGWQYALSVYATLTHPLAFSYTGGFVAYSALHPFEMYAPVEITPHLPTIYGPVYPLLLAVFHATLPDVFTVFQSGRLLTRWISLCAAFAIFGIVRHQTGRVTPGVLAAGLYLLAPIVSGVTVQLRVDHLSVLFGLVAIGAYQRRTGWNRLTWIIVFATLAVFTKQSMVVVPAAITLAYWHDRGLLSSWPYGFSQAGVGLTVLAFIGALTDWRIITHLFAYNTEQAFYLHRVFDLTSAFIIGYGPLLLAGIIVFVFATRRELPVIIAAFTALSFALAIATIGKEGAWIGYFLPVVAGLCLVFGIALGELQRVSDTHPLARWAVALLVLTAGAQFALYAAYPVSPEVDTEAQQQVYRWVQAADGPVLSEDSSILVAAGKDGEIFDPLVMKGPAEAGLWEETQLEERIQRGEFTYIISRTRANTEGASRWSARLRAAILDRYVIAERAGGYYVYVPT